MTAKVRQRARPVDDASVEPERLYRLPELMARTGCGVAFFRNARRKGLPVRYVGRCAFIAGSDFIAHVAEHGRREK